MWWETDGEMMMQKDIEKSVVGSLQLAVGGRLPTAD